MELKQGENILHTTLETALDYKVRSVSPALWCADTSRVARTPTKIHGVYSTLRVNIM